MPEGLLAVVLMLSLGYLLLVFELFVPGGVVGFLGLGLVALSCWRAFDLGAGWGAAAVGLSVVATAGGIVLFNRSKTGRELVLDNRGSRQWRSSADELDGLLGQQGITLSSLRPAGLADFEGRRLDVVSDSEFIDHQTLVRVVEVEGRRVMVERVESPSDSASGDAVSTAGPIRGDSGQSISAEPAADLSAGTPV